MRRLRRAKIVATLGPSSSSKDMIARLFVAGADVFRINMSHTSHEKLADLVATLREIESEYGRPIGILIDLQGPKLRLGEIAEGVGVAVGAQVSFELTDRMGDGTSVPLPHPEIFSGIQPGHELLIDDGKLRFRAITVDRDKILAEVLVGGPLMSRKGVSLPDSIVPVAAMTAKDSQDLEYALRHDVDWVALSFVQRPEDVTQLRRVTRGRAAIMAKIEKPSAVQQIDAILEISDGVMVARGDLGVEMPLQKVPGVQKQITRAARRVGKPVIVATQMLESMIHAPVPTRAEVSDVATAVYDGADAVMLSAESAAGAYPEEAVSTIDRIAREVESDETYTTMYAGRRMDPQATGADAISAAMKQIAETLQLSAIVCYTSSGATGMRAARTRPGQPIVALTPRLEVGRRLALSWGLHCVLTEDAHDEQDMVNRACNICFQEGFAKPGQRIIISAGVPFGTPGATNMLRVAFISADGRSGF